MAHCKGFSTLTPKTATGKFWALAIFYAADILNIQYRANLEMSPHEPLYWPWTRPDVNH